MRVFVLLFNSGTDNEGIHTLKVSDRNVVLMFENEDDATRYALMLEAQDFGSPSVEAFDADEIESFCAEANYECKLVPTGMLTMPPEASVDSTDWRPDGAAPDRLASQTDTETQTEFSQDELDRIRKTLEGLL
jgi:hypothetical protein